jgi:hypothetical protein
MNERNIMPSCWKLFRKPPTNNTKRNELEPLITQKQPLTLEQVKKLKEKIIVASTIVRNSMTTRINSLSQLQSKKGKSSTAEKNQINELKRLINCSESSLREAEKELEVLSAIEKQLEAVENHPVEKSTSLSLS